MYVFTNTITTLYDYYVKLVIYSDNGLTGTTTATNGGYIISIGDTEEGVDPFTGEYKPGGLSLEFIDKDNVFSAGVFGGSIAEMEARLWVSYDAGTTYECIFYGTVEHEGLTRVDMDATETTNRRFRVDCKHNMLSLRDVEIDTDPDAGTNAPTQGIVTPGATLSSYATDANGSPFSGTSYSDYKFISLDGVLQYIFANIQFIAGATAPTLAYDSSAMQHKGKNIASATEWAFDKLYMLFDAPSVPTAEGFFSYSSGKYGAYSLKNIQEMLRLFMDSLVMIPITRMTESGGAHTLNVYFEPRFRAAAGLTALTGTLDYTITRTMSVAEALDGYQVLTTGLPAEPDVTYSTFSYGGRTFELRNHLMTGPYFNVDPYVFIFTHIVPTAGIGLDTVRHDGPSAQMLYGINGATVENIHLFKHLAAQSYYGNAVSGGYYGVHGSAYNLLSTNLDPRTRASICGPRGYEITAKTLATNDSGTKSIWDLRLLKKITIDSVTCQIINIRRSVSTNTVTIRVIEVL